MYLGDYIVIEEQTGPFTFQCCSVSTNTPFIAEIDPDKRHLFADHSWIDEHPSACRFLRPDGDRIRCTIHRDSPVQCKFYRCVIMRVTGTDGREIGTITGTLALHSEDPALRAIYDAALREIREENPHAEDRLSEYLQKHGYRIG